MGSRFSCCLIGGNSLLIRCGDELLANSHDIRGVISNDSIVRSWCRQHSLRWYGSEKEYLLENSGETFDYLFSIVHLHVVSSELIGRATHHAINFHDGKLPDYRGLNVTAWAILNQEQRHSVTWHVMLATVDTGEVLVEDSFDIGADDTVLALNARCFEAGWQTFKVLLQAIEKAELKPQQQRKLNSSCKQYMRRDRPSYAAFVDWDAMGSEISALIRSTDHGSHANPLYAAKTVYNDRVVVLQQVFALESISKYPSGTVVAVGNEDEGVIVSTGSHDVRIGLLYDQCGERLIPQDVIVVGEQFVNLTTEERESICNWVDMTVDSENYWRLRLRQVEALDIPYATRTLEVSPNEFNIKTTVLSAVTTKLGSHNIKAIIALYLAKITNQSCIDLPLLNAKIASSKSKLESVFAAVVPLHIDFHNDEFVDQYFLRFDKLYVEAQQHSSFALDVVFRQAETRSAGAQWLTGRKSVIVCDANDVCTETGLQADLWLAIDESGRILWKYDTARYCPATIQRMEDQLLLLLQRSASKERTSIAELEFIPEPERERILNEWNATDFDHDRSLCIHEHFQKQVEKTPESAALVFRETRYCYRELNERANQMAAYLQDKGVTSGSYVGVLLERSDQMIIAMMAILKTGAAYVPLDPSYPIDRLSYMVEDSGLTYLLSQTKHKSLLEQSASVTLLTLDESLDAIDTYPTFDPDTKVIPADLAYVIYTSGSTGNPKGVMIEHRNVVNFFAGMDTEICVEQPGVWLALTSISFDISVLELFWTLCRGFEVVLHADRIVETGSHKSDGLKHQDMPMGFSLFFWNHVDEKDKDKPNKYELLFDCATFADENEFTALWTPERHFQSFGGNFPNPSVIGAALAARTENVAIRAGSVVAPLHSPIRIAEEWSVVDNLAGGKTGLAFAAGWQPNDFAIKPENHANSKQVMLDSIDQVRSLWRGETLEMEGAKGPVSVSTLPRPISKEIPIWLTTAGNVESFKVAGEKGCRILTHLLGQNVEVLQANIDAYRQSWKKAGHEGDGYVTVMLHTLVSDDEDKAKELCREPMKAYLKSAVSLVKDAAWHFPTYQEVSKESGQSLDDFFASAAEKDMDAILEFAFTRYFEQSGLLGEQRKCVKMVDQLKGIGVNEIGCLVDFGVEESVVLDHLPKLAELRSQCNQPSHSAQTPINQHETIDDLISAHGVTHMQCTPSQANILVGDDQTHASLAKLRHWLIGGEALSIDLVRKLRNITNSRLSNMYGPTETTIWSTVSPIMESDESVSVGRPIANTRIYILDDNQKMLPIGSPGELVIGGEGVVRGYHNRKELTDEKFLPDPYFENGSRMYRTGDLARYSADGSLEYIGRLDFQAKIRGYRIELGEIESAISQCIAIDEAVVIIRDGAQGDKHLIAYIVQTDKTEFSEQDVRRSLSATLPEFMIPSAFVTMDQFPLTLNGKIDRKSLPEPSRSRVSASSEPFVEPASDIEKTVKEIWSEFILSDHISANDNFFDIGGHSLMAVQVLVELRARIAKPIEITDLFRHTTIRQIANFIDSDNEDAHTDFTQSTVRAAARRKVSGASRRQAMRANSRGRSR